MLEPFVKPMVASYNFNIRAAVVVVKVFYIGCCKAILEILDIMVAPNSTNDP